MRRGEAWWASLHEPAGSEPGASGSFRRGGFKSSMPVCAWLLRSSRRAAGAEETMAVSVIGRGQACTPDHQARFKKSVRPDFLGPATTRR